MCKSSQKQQVHTQRFFVQTAVTSDNGHRRESCIPRRRTNCIFMLHPFLPLGVFVANRNDSPAAFLNDRHSYTIHRYPLLKPDRFYTNFNITFETSFQKSLSGYNAQILLLLLLCVQAGKLSMIPLLRCDRPLPSSSRLFPPTLFGVLCACLSLSLSLSIYRSISLSLSLLCYGICGNRKKTSVLRPPVSIRYFLLVQLGEYVPYPAHVHRR